MWQASGPLKKSSLADRQGGLHGGQAQQSSDMQGILAEMGILLKSALCSVEIDHTLHCFALAMKAAQDAVPWV